MSISLLTIARQEFESARNRYTYLLDRYGLLIYVDEPTASSFPPEVAAALATVQCAHERLMRLLGAAAPVPSMPLTAPEIDFPFAQA